MRAEDLRAIMTEGEGEQETTTTTNNYTKIQKHNWQGKTDDGNNWHREVTSWKA